MYMYAFYYSWIEAAGIAAQSHLINTEIGIGPKVVGY